MIFWFSAFLMVLILEGCLIGGWWLGGGGEGGMVGKSWSSLLTGITLLAEKVNE